MKPIETKAQVKQAKPQAYRDGWVGVVQYIQNPGEPEHERYMVAWNGRGMVAPYRREELVPA